MKHCRLVAVLFGIKATDRVKSFLFRFIAVSGDCRFVVLPIVRRGRDYKTLQQERAFAQAYYLATHPKAFKLEITEDEIAK